MKTTNNLKRTSTSIEYLIQIMKALRDPDSGCPWDIEQTFETIAPYTIEEAYEVADAINRRNMSELKDELGDLLLQVVYHTQIAEELGEFNFEDVVQSVSDKMITRHPHVFGDQKIESSEELTKNWENQKMLHTSVTNDQIESLFQTASTNGAIGGKACGAGGGGCLLFYCQPDQEHQVRKSLSEAGAQILDFTFDFSGLQTWTSEPEK